ncbi:MAG: PilZ domain-containing protein [Gammaproteobacteria bacterium]
MIEHRWNFRVPVQTRVNIRRRWFRSTTGTIRDISFEGMYVETLNAPELINNTVEVAIPVTNQSRRTVIKVPGLVVRSTDNGIGLLLADYDDEIFQRLAALLAPALDQQR